MTALQRQLCVGQYRPGDEADILAMNLSEYGPNNVMVNPESFHWRYAENPAGSAEITVVRNEETNRVVGFTWTVPIRMRLFGHNYLAAMTANQLIHPDFRDSLAYTKLLRKRLQLLRNREVPFRFNFPIETLYERTASIEKMSSFLIPLLVRPVKIYELSRMIFRNKWLNIPLGWFGRIASPFLFHSETIQAKGGKYKIEWLERFDERFDEFWKRVVDKYSIMTIRDCAFLSWRFTPVDGRAYRILTASRDGKLVGYAVIRLTDEIRGIPIGLIMDFLVELGSQGDEAGGLIMEELWQYQKAEKSVLAGCLALPHTQEYRIMRRAGYLAVPKKLAPRLFRVAYNCFAETLPATDQVKSGDWFISIADYEAH